MPLKPAHAALFSTALVTCACLIQCLTGYPPPLSLILGAWVFCFTLLRLIR